MRSRKRLLVAALVAGAAVIAAGLCWRLLDSSSHIGRPPLAPDDDPRLAFHLKADHGVVDDIDPAIPLENATEDDIRILDVEWLPDEESPGVVTVEMFRLAGPDRTTHSLSGGLLDADDFGAPLLSAENAVIPSGAGSRDYILVVRVAADPDADWSASRGMRITYEWKGKTYESVWNRDVTYCSQRAAGPRFCSQLE